MKELEGAVAVVTGASKGIGRAVARMLCAEGAKVVIAARGDDLEPFGRELAEIGPEPVCVRCDVRRQEDVERLRDVTLAVGAPDILVANAGIGLYAPITETSMDDFDDIMATNVRGTYALVQTLLPSMLERGSGHVVVLASVAGLHGFPNETAYCTSKFAQVGFAQALDNEVRERGIKVSCICPGGVNTEFALGRGRTKGDPMLEQFMTADDIAKAVRLAVTTGPTTRILNVAMRSMLEPVA
jgi:NAD(P)-dependent dehydrogenase (short-subunit alcohol dehydrogenase family)